MALILLIAIVEIMKKTIFVSAMIISSL